MRIPRSNTVLSPESHSRTTVTCLKTRGQHRNQKATPSRMNFLIFIRLRGSKLNAILLQEHTWTFKILYIAFLLLLLRSVVKYGLGNVPTDKKKLINCSSDSNLLSVVASPLGTPWLTVYKNHRMHQPLSSIPVPQLKSKKRCQTANTRDSIGSSPENSCLSSLVMQSKTEERRKLTGALYKTRCKASATM